MDNKKDMTVGTGWKKVLVFSLPLMLGNILQQLYNTVDGIVVGKYVSDTALAAVGNCSSLTFLLVGIASGLSNGCGIVMAQYVGAKKTENIRKTASTAFCISGLGGLLMSALVFFSAEAVLGGLMNIKEADILAEAVTYMKIYACGMLFQFIYNAVSAIMRAHGDSKAALYFLTVSTMTNLVLDLVFVLKFHLGVAGVAYATIIAQFISSLFCVIYMRRKFENFRFKLSEIRYDGRTGKTILKMGLPSALQFSVIGFGGVLMQRIVNHFGKVLMAAFVVGNRIENYIFIPIHAFGTGMSTFTGQNMGAGQVDRVKECWKKIILCSAVFSGCLSVCVYLLAVPISSLFGLEGESLELSVTMIHFLACFAVIFSVYIPTGNVLSGSGDAYFAMLCSFSTLFLRVLAASLMVYVFDVGPHSIWYSIPIGWAFSLGLALFRYFSGKWQEKAITRMQE